MDSERATRAGRRIAIELMHGNAEACHQIIDDTLKPMLVARTRDEKLRLPLTETGISQRVCNQLEGAGLHTVEQLLNTHRIELLSIPMFGMASFREVVSAMHSLGFGEESRAETT